MSGAGPGDRDELYMTHCHQAEHLELLILKVNCLTSVTTKCMSKWVNVWNMSRIYFTVTARVFTVLCLCTDHEKMFSRLRNVIKCCMVV